MVTGGDHVICADEYSQGWWSVLMMNTVGVVVCAAEVPEVMASGCQDDPVGRETLLFHHQCDIAVLFPR